ncbi:MAG: hypothetical protein JXR76_03575 [Deltaproteobacteria bacterium]|nr:hypothetical protein [Deltaproteobacteria bacterium]
MHIFRFCQTGVLLVLAAAMTGLWGCDPDLSLVLSREGSYVTAVDTWSEIMVSLEGDVDDPVEIPNAHIEKVSIENSDVLVAKVDNGNHTVWFWAKAPGRTKVTIHTDYGSQSVTITAVKSDSVRVNSVQGTHVNLPEPATWLKGGRDDVTFTWMRGDTPLAGANLDNIQSATTDLLTVIPISSTIDFPSFGDATLVFSQTGMASIHTPEDLDDIALEIVDETRIHHISPVYLPDTESGYDGNQSDTHLVAGRAIYDWWRTVAYDEDNLRIGGLDGAVHFELLNSSGCDLYSVADEFSLYRQTPGSCTVNITIGVFEESVTYTYQ